MRRAWVRMLDADLDALEPDVQMGYQAPASFGSRRRRALKELEGTGLKQDANLLVRPLDVAVVTKPSRFGHELVRVLAVLGHAM